MDSRAVILARAAELLAASPTGDMSTRAVCEAAGVTQPVLYRHFGDKDGLLSAVADESWEKYLAGKRAAAGSADPLDDLRTGWDAHTAFAQENPNAYRLVFGGALTRRPAAFAEALGLLAQITQRLAVQGRLCVTPTEAAQVVMAANSGFALGLLLRSEVYVGTSDVVREATLRGILIDPDAVSPPNPAAGAAITLRAGLPASRVFTPAEAALFDEWLSRMERDG
ncbi:TetR/AcrR family transcriptional regulator [Gordonia effusa]|uniref:TetR/AcrR family transcriptional regulator n=1 Tax=Gordonia effusa TaxID=263908 RepID=UPI00058C1002|nr:TetR/AcrR family transcriptional regulator [Gordonia effusa]